MKRGQEKRIARAYRKRRGCRITLHPQCAVGGGGNGGCCTTGRLSLSAAHLKRMQKSAGDNNGGDAKKPVTLPFSHADLERNAQVSGGFIPMILAAIASSIAGGLIERGIAGAGISGSGFLWRHGTGACHLKPVEGGGLHITPYRGKFAPGSGAGLYLAPWPRGRGLMPKPAGPEDVRKITASHKRILKALVRQAIKE